MFRGFGMSKEIKDQLKELDNKMYNLNANLSALIHKTHKEVK